jgi:4-carboxymuconolactone decarboxylase|tara:strand:+ start:857 stop:1252 length:396 start_codon:yes stop_codon:yes gene_type:complete
MDNERYEQGKAIALSVLGKSGKERIEQLSEISPMHGRAIFEYCYGTVWAQPNLSIKIKLFILISVCASQGEYDGVERQVRGALNKGATQDEIIEAITTCAPYIGYPRTNASLRAAQEVFDQWDEKDDWKSI